MSWPLAARTQPKRDNTTVTSSRLDHGRTKVFAISESGLWLVTPGDNGVSAALISRAYLDAQILVYRAGNDPTMTVRARQQAEQVLGVFVGAMGWKVTVRWSKS